MDRRVLVWDEGHDYVNYEAALSAVGLEAVVSADREEAARCAALLLPGGGDIADRLPPEEERVIAAFTAAEKPILGICRGLQALKEPCTVELYSDSKYVIDALEKGWARSWQQRGWVKSDKKPALNPDLWGQLLALTDIHEVRCHWVKGHAENEKNNRCDQMAVAESRKFQ